MKLSAAKLTILLLLAALALAGTSLAAGAGPALLSKGAQAYEFADYGQARVLLNQAMAAGGLSREQKAWVHTYLGAIALKDGDNETASRHFRRADSVAPEFQPPAWALEPQVLKAYAAALGDAAPSPPSPPPPPPSTPPPKRLEPAPQAETEPLPAETDIAQAASVAAADYRRQARLAKVGGVTHFNAKRYARAAKNFSVYLKVFPEDTVVSGWRRQALSLADAMNHGMLAVHCRPTAQVLLDGKLMGVTPLTLPRVAVGSRRVEVTAHGASQRKVINIRGRTAYEVKFTLSGGVLEVKSQPWARAFFDGREIGQTPLRHENLVVGPHELRLVRQGYQDQEHRVVLRNQRTTELNVKLIPK